MNDNKKFKGLSSEQAKRLLEENGKNELNPPKKESPLKKALHTLCEPMFLLLLAASVIYFILGEPRDGVIMLLFVVVIIGIDIFQQRKTDKTLAALKNLSAPRSQVIRDDIEITIPSSELVPGDILLLCEGAKIPADGEILSCSDLCVDESSLTGESEGVWKHSVDSQAKSDGYWRRDYCYAGTLVTQGSATVLVKKTGANTEYGKIGKNIAEAPDMPTPLQKQTGRLVKICAFVAAALFLLVAVVTFINTAAPTVGDAIIQSILSGVTLAMAMIPEEFPVVLTVFLSMGAWRLARKNSLVRKMPSVETLGCVSVLCVDKTGTITLNDMTVTELCPLGCEKKHLAYIMGVGCEKETYDPMENAMLKCCDDLGLNREYLFSGELIKEYAFTNKLKMMGHVWKKDNKVIIAAKGSPEAIIPLCKLSNEERSDALNRFQAFSAEGLRVIAVAQMSLASDSEIPSELTDCQLELLGLVGLMDPPRPSVDKDIALCSRAGIRVIMITGDGAATASSIARKVGIQNSDKIITGEMLDQMSDEELVRAVKTVNVFSRVIPEHKMRIVKAIKSSGEVVAMTGDGVNDAAALKYADIGIAMGKRGSEVSREAADLILLDDNFSTIVDSVRDGRRIFDNIKRAVGYIFSIHVPIAAASLIAPMLGITSGSLMLLPLHIVLLELIIDPTCSIVLERQPAEKDIMQRPPRSPKAGLVTLGGMIKSLIQGGVIFAASFGSYLFYLNSGFSAEYARSMGLSIIILSNLLLVFVNSSEKEFMINSLKVLARDKVMWITAAATVVLVALVLYTPLSGPLNLVPLCVVDLAIAVALAVASVCWYELVKLVRRIKTAHKHRD